MSLRKATNAAEVWRVAVLPNTSPVLVLKAAYSDSVPCLKYSKPWRSARPGDSGRTGPVALDSVWVLAIHGATSRRSRSLIGWYRRPLAVQSA